MQSSGLLSTPARRILTSALVLEATWTHTGCFRRKNDRGRGGVAAVLKKGQCGCNFFCAPCLYLSQVALEGYWEDLTHRLALTTSS